MEWMLIRWEVVLFICAAVGITVGCLIPARWLPRLPNDKLMHFLAFGGLTLLAGQIAQSRFELILWLLGLFCAGWAIEAMQNWVPDRKFCWRDLGANTAGILLAAVCTPHVEIMR